MQEISITNLIGKVSSSLMSSNGKDSSRVVMMQERTTSASESPMLSSTMVMNTSVTVQDWSLLHSQTEFMLPLLRLFT